MQSVQACDSDHLTMGGIVGANMEIKKPPEGGSCLEYTQAPLLLLFRDYSCFP